MAVNGKPQDRRQWVLTALEQFEGRLTRFALRLLGDEQAARDVVQHAFLKLCDQQPQQLDSRLAEWLYTVCRNKAIDLLRHTGRFENALDHQPLERVSREGDPAELAENRDTHQRLRQLVSHLPLRQREALELWTAGLSYREIASITNRSEGAVRAVIHRTLTKLRQHPWVQSMGQEKLAEK